MYPKAMFWPQCDKPSCLGRSPKHDSVGHFRPRGQTYVGIFGGSKNGKRNTRCSGVIYLGFTPQAL